MSVMLVDHLRRRPCHPGHFEAIDAARDHFADCCMAKGVHHNRSGKFSCFDRVLEGFLPRILVPRLPVLRRQDGSVGDFALGLLVEEADGGRRQGNDAMPGLPVEDECALLAIEMLDAGAREFARPASSGTLQLRQVLTRAVLGSTRGLKPGGQSNQSAPENWGHIWGHGRIRKFRKALCGEAVIDEFNSCSPPISTGLCGPFARRPDVSNRAFAFPKPSSRRLHGARSARVMGGHSRPAVPRQSLSFLQPIGNDFARDAAGSQIAKLEFLLRYLRQLTGLVETRTKLAA